MNSTPQDIAIEIVLTLSLFVRALRNAEVRVSPAETLDAMSILELTGVRDPGLFKNALAMSLAKTPEEKLTFDETFDRFFGSFAFQSPPKKSVLGSTISHELVESIRTEVSPNILEGALMTLLQGRRDLLSLEVQRASAASRIYDIRSLREKRDYFRQLSAYMGLNELSQIGTDGSRSPELRYLNSYVRDELKNYVDAQYQNHVDATGKRAILESALRGQLRHIPYEYHAAIREVIHKLADRLMKNHRKRSVNDTRGRLDIKRTLRSNVAYDANLFDLRWRRKQRKTASVFVLCDVSNSVSQIARFLLLFLYELVDILPRIRAFAFSSALGEVTEIFGNHPSERAIEETLFHWGKGNTDYGRAIRDFRATCSTEVDHRSTLIVFGDARSNYYDPGVKVFRELTRRVKQVYWLNPEEKHLWREGDSEMYRFAPYCTRVAICRKLSDIERFADRLIANTR